MVKGWKKKIMESVRGASEVADIKVGNLLVMNFLFSIENHVACYPIKHGCNCDMDRPD